MRTSAARNNNASHPPLAYDPEGRPIAMPEGSAWWGLKCCTAGRPKAVLGPDRRAVRLPLDATADEIAETYGADTYRLDALDEHGNAIDHVTTIVIGDPGEDDDDEPERRSGGAGGRAGSDWRFALQTITDMARAQSDALKVVAMAQADYVKGLASAKAIPRNTVYAAPPRSLPAPSDSDEDDEEEEDDDEDDDTASDETPEPPPTPGPQEWLAKANELGQTIYKIGRDGPGFYAAFRNMLGKPGQAPRNASPEAAPSAPPPAASEATPSAPPVAAPDAGPPPPTPHAATPNPIVHFCAIEARLSRPARGWLRRVLRTEYADSITRELLARTVPAAVALVKEVFARDLARGPDEVRPEDAAPAAAAPAAAAPAVTVSEDELRARVVAVAALLTPDEQAAVFGVYPRLSPARLEQLSAQLVAMTVEEAAAWIRENLPRLQAEVSS